MSRLVKGSHIVVRKFWEGAQAYLVQNTDKRVIFVNPYEDDKALIGTTDIPYEGAAGGCQPDPIGNRLPPESSEPILQAAAHNR